MTEYQKNAEEFLQIAPQFALGTLPTEMQHPKTLTLSTLARKDLPRAIATLQAIDLDTLKVLSSKLDEVAALASAIRTTLERGGRIFLCGCGSTGRLSLALETLWRELHPEPDRHERVVSFMAGGDIALIKAVEEFEDYPAYGARQLRDLGFSRDDVLISTTEGGETPFVIGATEYAADLSDQPPYFLCCNPEEILRATVERSKRVLEHPAIRKLNLSVGPMAISGSTRMQATTILMLAVGLALTHAEDPEPDDLARDLDALFEWYAQHDLSWLSDFIQEESERYQNQGYLFYQADEDFAISILTDTTERAPTFSLHPFENVQDRGRTGFAPSLCYLALPGASTAQEAWRLLLGREPRALMWPQLEGRVDLTRLYGHDFSRHILDARREYLADAPHSTFAIKKVGETLMLRLDSLEHRVDLRGLSRLAEHLVLKMLLNTHSTLVMGRLGRYEGNLMTYVRPSNNKLIDRVIRYVRLLLTQRGVERSYESVAFACFQEMEHIHPDEPIVLRIVERLLGGKTMEAIRREWQC